MKTAYGRFPDEVINMHVFLLLFSKMVMSCINRTVGAQEYVSVSHNKRPDLTCDLAC